MLGWTALCHAGRIYGGRDQEGLLVTVLEEKLREVAAPRLASMPRTGIAGQLAYLCEPLFDFFAADPALSRALMKGMMFFRCHGPVRRKICARLPASLYPRRMTAEGDVLEFWYDHASTYSYPAAMRVEAESAKCGVRVAWRPFLLGPIFERLHARSDSPFNANPPRLRYMWRDVERLCAAGGLPFRVPGRMPRNSSLAARVAIVGLDEGWTPRFSCAVYRANFADDRDIGDQTVIAAILEEVGLPAPEILERAVSPDYKPRLRAATAEAAERGIFGSPTFFRRGEMFFGGDRLAQALAWPELRRVP